MLFLGARTAMALVCVQPSHKIKSRHQNRIHLICQPLRDSIKTFSECSVITLHFPYHLIGHMTGIDLLPGAPLPSSHLYNLSRPEAVVMEKSINESLVAGIICLSLPLVSAGFFFVAKKDKTLGPCINFQKLNSITIKTNILCLCCL